MVNDMVNHNLCHCGHAYETEACRGESMMLLHARKIVKPNCCPKFFVKIVNCCGKIVCCIYKEEHFKDKFTKCGQK